MTKSIVAQPKLFDARDGDGGWITWDLLAALALDGVNVIPAELLLANGNGHHHDGRPKPQPRKETSVGARLMDCPVPHCGGSLLLTWYREWECHLCGRDPWHPAMTPAQWLDRQFRLGESADTSEYRRRPDNPVLAG